MWGRGVIHLGIAVLGPSRGVCVSILIESLPECMCVKRGAVERLDLEIVHLLWIWRDFQFVSWRDLCFKCVIPFLLFSKRPSGFESRGKHASETPQDAFMPPLFSFKDLLIDSVLPHESPHRHVKERWVGFIQIPFLNFLTANLGQLWASKECEQILRRKIYNLKFSVEGWRVKKK